MNLTGTVDKVQFDANGQNFTWNGSYFQGSQTYAYLGGNSQATDTNAVLATTDTNYLWSLSVVYNYNILDLNFYEGRTLTAGTYTFVQPPNGQGNILGGFMTLTMPNPLNENNSWTVTPGDTVSVTVSQVNGEGLASGTFSAKLENPDAAPIYVTGGTFSNVIVTTYLPNVTPP